MKIIHRISLTPDELDRNFLLSLGLPLIESKSDLVRLVSFDIEEGDELWPKVKAFIAQRKPADFAHTEFTDRELDEADFLQMLGMQKGYPQPSGTFGYMKVTYDVSEYCKDCGFTNQQVAPFRMKGEPKWGKWQILQLNWVYDEYFVPPTIWEEVFRPFGIGCRAVLEHRTGNELQTVVQLEIKHKAESQLALDGKYPSEICATCGREKFLPICRGYFPAFVQEPSYPLCKTQEHFGSGGSAWNATIIHRSLYKAMRDHKLKGGIFVPLQAT